MIKSRSTRRNFLAASAAGIAAPLIIPASALGRDGHTAPSERITMATIGTGSRGTGDMKSFLAFPQVQMVAVCDPVKSHRATAQQIVNERYSSKDCTDHNDFRDVLDRADIDAVLIGTPDHWHAIMTIAACRAGKDVFCEKPECLTIRQGRAMVDAARMYGRVVSGGSQRVLGDYGDTPRLVRGGAIGDVTEVFVSCGGPSGECYLPTEEIPVGVDWDLWLGPAPWRPFHSSLLKGQFRPWRDYSGGGMTDWGAHRFGAALFATGLHHTGPVEILPPNGEDVERLTYVFENGAKFYHGGTNNILYRGTEGEIPGVHPSLLTRVDMEGYKGSGGIFGDFLHCVKTRELPFRDIEVAHRAVSVCHLGNIAYWLNRPLKWNPVTEEIIGDPEASRWLDRPRRGDWTLT
ncbi:MAG: Gfo/Idh/MocA family oxidoreductase [Planctomycetaceae bacterium]|nr:Gfo/Idh/MocA family oxidoreductase [Planctomycetaceae bacterium]